MPENKRIQYIDVAKFLGILLVVFIHGYKEGIVISFIYSFHMPLFFFLNGMTLKMDDISFGDFVLKKLKAYVIPGIGLGILCALMDALIRSILNISWDINFVLQGICNAINQIRHLGVWFLTALFFSDLFLFAIYRKCKKNIWLTGLGVLALLGFGIFYNTYKTFFMTWNIDVAFFGTLFTYFGFLFTSKKLSSVYEFLTGSRGIALLAGIVLLVETFFLSNYIRNHTTMINGHLDMYGSHYGTYFLPLVCALIGSLGFVILCRALSNFVLAYPVKYNLALLAVHQTFAFPLFQGVVARPWWESAAFGLPQDLNFNLFVLTMTLFSVLVAVVFYYIIIVTPLSFVLGRPRYPLFEKIIQRVRK